MPYTGIGPEHGKVVMRDRRLNMLWNGARLGRWKSRRNLKKCWWNGIIPAIGLGRNNE